MALGVVAGLKNGELLVAGVVRRYCRDKMVDRLCSEFELYSTVDTKPVADLG